MSQYADVLTKLAKKKKPPAAPPPPEDINLLDTRAPTDVFPHLESGNFGPVGDWLQENADIHPNAGRAGQIISALASGARGSSFSNNSSAESPEFGHIRVEPFIIEGQPHPYAWMAHLHYPQGKVHSFAVRNVHPENPNLPLIS